MGDQQLSEARAVRRLVCAYELGALPTWWLMVHRRLKASAERQGWRVKVDLVPLSSLPQEVDMLVVPRELAPMARARAPEAEVVPIGPDEYPRGVLELVDRLADASRYRIERVEPRGPDAPPEPRIVRYVGYERAD